MSLINNPRTLQPLMKLTCVTAVFNAIKSGNRENLIRCVKSVAALKTEHEHLIYDGASTDGTVELLRELEAKTPGLKVVSEPDTGIYNALNKGVRDAKGEWFYVLGCDDYICWPEVLDRIISGAKGFEIVATEVFLDEVDGGRVRHVDYDAILRDVPYCHQGVVMSSAMVRRFNGFDECHPIAADYKLMLMGHLSGVKVQCLRSRDAMFACFGMRGISESNLRVMRNDVDLVSAEVLGIDVSYMPLFRKRGYLPMKVFMRHIFSSDMLIKMSARRMFYNWSRKWIRIVFLPIVIASRPLRHRIGR